MLYLLNIYLINGNHINLINWIAYIFDLQGFLIYVYGAEHLWYLTIIMICYLITPILNKNKSKMNKKYFKAFKSIYTNTFNSSNYNILFY